MGYFIGAALVVARDRVSSRRAAIRAASTVPAERSPERKMSYRSKQLI